MLNHLQEAYADRQEKLLRDLQLAAINNRNMFEELLEVCKYCSLGQITNSLFEVGGQYRRNM